jgi:ferrochelatase
MSSPQVGLVVMAYGTPASPDDIESYYTHIRRGNAPTPEQLADLTARYQAIGGTSPLAQRTEAQRRGLLAALEAADPGRWTVVLGQKHAAPFIEDAVATLADAGAQAVTGLVLAPHFSAASIGQYHERLIAAAADHDLPVAAIGSWHLEPSYVEFLAAAVRDGLEPLPDRTEVLFTAHSLPERALVGDPYPDQLRESASAVAEAVGLDPGTWSVAYQSAGRTADPWRGPDILEVLDDVAASSRADGVLVCPQGFVSDHLEVVYDLDIEAQQRADGLGVAFARTRVVNDDPTVMGALAELVRGSVPDIGGPGAGDP